MDILCDYTAYLLPRCFSTLSVGFNFGTTNCIHLVQSSNVVHKNPISIFENIRRKLNSKPTQQRDQSNFCLCALRSALHSVSSFFISPSSELCARINEIVKKMLFTLKLIMISPKVNGLVYRFEKCSTSSAMVRRQSTDLFVWKKCGIFSCRKITILKVVAVNSVGDANWTKIYYDYLKWIFHAVLHRSLDAVVVGGQLRKRSCRWLSRILKFNAITVFGCRSFVQAFYNKLRGTCLEYFDKTFSVYFMRHKHQLVFHVCSFRAHLASSKHNRSWWCWRWSVLNESIEGDIWGVEKYVFATLIINLFSRRPMPNLIEAESRTAVWIPIFFFLFGRISKCV